MATARRHGGQGGLEPLADLPAALACVAGPDLVFEFANCEFRRMVGQRRLIGLPLREALPELAPEQVGRLGSVLKTGVPLDRRGAEIWVPRRGRPPEQRFVDFFCRPVRDASGGAGGLLLFGADVTGHVEDRRAFQALAEHLASSEERQRKLFETLPQGVISLDRDGSVVAANPAASEMLGLTLESMTIWPLLAAGATHEDGVPFRPTELPGMVALRTGQVVEGVVAGVPRSQGDDTRWLRITAAADAPDEHGRPQRVHYILGDITEQRRARATLRAGGRLLDRLRETNVLGVVESTEDGVQDANDAFLDITGYSRAELEAGQLSYRAITPAEWAGQDQSALAQLRSAGAFRAFDKEYIHRDGHRVPVMVAGAVIGRDPLRWVTFVIDLTARQRAEDERARLRMQERAARDEADSARERLAFLLRAGDLVAATRDRQELLQRAAQLVVPGLADYSVVFLPAPDGRLSATALAHRDPEGAIVLADLRAHPLPVSGPMTAQAAYNLRTSQLKRDLATRLPQWTSLPRDVSEILERLHGDTVLAVPLMAGQTPLGVLDFVRKVDRPGFTEADVAVAEEFSRRLADAMVNADTFEREHTIAETLQHAVLPDQLPSIPGLDLAVRYLPATDSAQVGGDWYDAFRVDADRIGLVIGDVAGHSMNSASVMGQIRSVLRAYALDNPSPPDVLQRTNTALATLLPEALATVCYAVLDQRTGELVFANGGHPPPLLQAAAGQTEFLDAPAGTMLGAAAESVYTPGRRQLAPGATLLLYTDGLIENASRDITEGMRALAAAVGGSAGHAAEQTCSDVQEALIGSSARADDVCVLALRLREPAALGHSPAGEPPPPGSVRPA